MPRRPLFAGVLALALVGGAGACGDDTPDRGPADGAEGAAAPPAVERPAFQGGRAFELLERQVAFGPRVPGTEAHRLQAEWMVEYLGERADTVWREPFEHVTTAGDTLELVNVHARFGPVEGRRILLLAHWDTRPVSDQAQDPALRSEPVPGANDGASGTAVLLELAELLATTPPPVQVELLLLDGEDYGPGNRDMFLGSRHYAAGLTASSRPTYGVLLDMVADADPRFPVEGYSAELAPQVVQKVWGVARELGYGPFFPYEVGPPVTDDHIPLNEAGVPTANVIDFSYGPGHRYWHTPRDVPENTSATTLEMVGEIVAELVYRGG